MATAEKIRIYDLARKINVSTKDIMAVLEKMGITVKSHSSTISAENAEKVKAVLKDKQEPKTAVVKTNVRPPRLIKKEKPVQIAEEEIEKEEVVKPVIITQPTPVIRQEPQKSEFKKPEPQKPQQRNDFKRPEHQKQEFKKPEFRKPDSQRNEFKKPEFKKPDSQKNEFRKPDSQRPQQRNEFKRPEHQKPEHQKQEFRKPEFRKPDSQRNEFRKPAPFQKQEKPAFPPRNQQAQPQPVNAVAPPVNAEQDAKDKTIHRKELPKKKDNFREREQERQERLEEQKLQSRLAAAKKKAKEESIEEVSKEIVIDGQLTVGELASKMNLGVATVIKQLMMSGVMATVNQVVDIETAKLAANALEYTVIEPEVKQEAEKNAVKHKETDETKLVERAPVVTIMGHVDHGKTTLLDSIRKTKHKIVSTEAGGITQSIGAYTAEINDRKIVFIDTPGHAAFTSMRARGAKVTDIVILVVAADDGIMPQTIEAINHAKAAKVPIIIAVNKIDKDGADPDRVLQQLTEHELVPEKWGGDTITVEVSALQGLNIEELLEYIILVSEIEELKANPHRPASGVIIESKLDKGKGAVATFLVQSGTLKVGDCVVAGTVGGRIRALIDDHGQRVEMVGPSTPVEILGLSEVPEAGEFFEVVENDKLMKDIVNKRKDETRMTKLEAIAPMQIKREMLLKGLEGETKDLNIIIKAATHGAAEAVNSALAQLESKKIFIKVVHLGVGDISEADIMLASASNAIVVGFGVKEDPNALRVAADEGVVIRKYDIIYKMMEDIEQTMLGLIEPEYKEVEIGTAEIRQIFTVGKTVKIGGCYVLEGKIIRNKEAIVIRENKEIYKGTISQLKRFKDDVKEVTSGYECGISFDKFNDIEIGDLIKVLSKEKIERHTLV